MVCDTQLNSTFSLRQTQTYLSLGTWVPRSQHQSLSNQPVVGQFRNDHWYSNNLQAPSPPVRVCQIDHANVHILTRNGARLLGSALSNSILCLPLPSQKLLDNSA